MRLLPLALLVLACRQDSKLTPIPPDVDVDGDGFLVEDDCNDEDAAINPDATEACDGVDNNCDGDVDEGPGSRWYADVDGDGYGDPDATTVACDQPAAYVDVDGDCDDRDEAVHPGVTEVCNGVDDDCNGTVDDGVGTVWYRDADGDGFGDLTNTTTACDAPDGYTDDATDCDDADRGVFPGAEELCNGVDDDCDGLIDEDGGDLWYADDDGDRFGDARDSIVACDEPVGYTSDDSDCDDTDPAVNPRATEVCNGVDDDCNGYIDDGLSGTWYADSDGDGYGDPDAAVDACAAPDGYVADDSDCDDADRGVHPGATEICNGIDDDCDGVIDEGVGSTWYADADGDGYGDAGSYTTGCSAPAGYVADASDCDDRDRSIHPGAAELCDGIDSDCDGAAEAADTVWYADADGDGYGDPSRTALGCTAPAGYVADDTDCNDASRSVHPGATEACNGIDDDCDGAIDEGTGGTWYADGDDDGYGDADAATTACSAPSGYVSDASDCDDTDETVYPGAPETCDGIDHNCDGVVTSDCPCDGANTGASFEDGRSMGGPGLAFGARFTASRDQTVSRIEVYTGEQTGTNTVALWTDDAARIWPLAQLAIGSWGMSYTNSWQGADLDAPVTLTGGTTYWMVWEPINGSQASWDASGTGVTYRGSYDHWASTTGLYSGGIKFQLYCY